jgi:hypothetical protein
MISKNTDRRVLSSQRQVMHGWTERRGGGRRPEIKLTAAGLAALQAPI